MTALGNVIRRQVATWGGSPLPNEAALFGAEDPDAIAANVDAWCDDHLGAGISRYLFFDSSSGSVHGVELTDGRPVVVKGHRAAVDAPFLTAVLGVQTDLAARGFPAPAVLVGPVPVGTGHLTAEALRPQHRTQDPHDPAVRRLLAAGLAHFVELAAPHLDALARHGHPLHDLVDGLYPVPHSSRFDFAATAAGAAWIDDLMRAARAQLATAPPSVNVVAHGDWRAQNVSIRAGRIEAVYDWDSVAVTDEMGAVAAAAATFGVDWSVPQDRRLSTPREIASFVTEYADGRGRPLSDAERARLAPQLVVHLAYGSRCEHADDPSGPVGPDTQRGLLRTLGAPLLRDGVEALSAA